MAGALDGVRVIDMTRVVAGPLCTQIMGDLGAEIAKIERRGHGDDLRALGPPFVEGTDDSTYFVTLNRNKRSVSLDFTQPEGAAADTWAAALAGLTGAQIAEGLRACVAEGEEFPPNAPRFRAMCLGIPSLARVRLEFSAPDGMVTVPDGVRVEENEGEFSVFPPPGLSQVTVWGAGGPTSVEVGAFRDLAMLRRELMASAPRTDVWAYVAVRHMLDAWVSDDLLDAVDRLIGDYQSQPTPWIAAAAALAGSLGLPVSAEAEAAATAVLARASRLDGILLALHGLLPIELGSGDWPVGDLGTLGRGAFAAIGFGRISTDPRPLRGADVAVAKLYAAALGESELGIRLAAYAQAAENRLLCQLSTQPSLTDVAWLSI